MEEISKQVLDHSYLNVARYPVGIESRVRNVNKLLLLEMNDVRMIGIWGTGGIGKTTIAKAVYNTIAHNFEGSCFLANVREHSMEHEGLVKLQKILLSKLLRESKLNITDADEGIHVLKERLSQKKVLLILDDVNHLKQLNKLAAGPDWFGLGSRIIITTRDKHLLTAHEVNAIEKVKELDYNEARELFSSNAIKGNLQCDSYVQHAINDVLLYAQGLPLALIVLGSLLRGRSTDQWRAILDSQRRFPSEEIQEVLKISYHALEYPVKEIFLDIACFFKGRNKNYVIETLEAGCDLNPRYGIEVLMEKALINITEAHDIWMHDVLEEMGREIVRQESPDEPGKRSRLWFPKDVYHVFEENTVNEKKNL